MRQVFRVLKIALVTIAVTAGGATTYLTLRRPAMAPPQDVHAEDNTANTRTTERAGLADNN